MFPTTSFADCSKSFTGFAFSPVMFIAIPTMIEKISSAMMLSFDSSFVKSFTVSRFTVLSAIVNSSASSVVSSSYCNACLMLSPSSVSTSFTKYVLANPISTAMIDVTINTPMIVAMILPSLFGVFIFVMDVVIVKKIKGTIITNNRFRNMSPSGFKIAAFSWNMIPMIAPTIIAAKRIIVDL